MNKDAIRKTAVCRLDKDEGLFVVESPLWDICAGVDEDQARAWEIFNELLDAMYVEYLEGKGVGRYERRGRPSKGGTILNVSVRPSTKSEIETLAKQLECSQGEAVDFLCAFYSAAQTMPAAGPKMKTRGISIAACIAEPAATYTASKRRSAVKDKLPRAAKKTR
jgi:hypothetical protein